MSEQELLLNRLLKSLDDNQANEVVVIDVRGQTTVTDYMIICSGRSSRHVRAIAELAMEDMKSAGLAPMGSTGLDSCEWALVDFGDFVLHVMQTDARSFYNIEGLWKNNPEAP